MKRTLFFLVCSFLFFTVSGVEASSIPQWVTEKCRKAVIAANPVKVNYNYGELSVDYSKSVEEVSNECGGNAAGCFHGTGGVSTHHGGNEGISIGKYYCSYLTVEFNFNYRGTYIDLTRDYNSCNARVVLRHELQHFMIWKTAKEQMHRELKNTLTDFVVKNIKICEGHCHNDKMGKMYEVARQIRKKWRDIKDINNKRLDDIDHNREIEVDYRVCAPYSLKFKLY